MSAALPRLFVALALAQSAFNIYWAALPIYFAQLGMDPAEIGILVGVAGIAQLGGALFVGPAIDRVGGRLLLLAGVCCFLIASLGYAAFTPIPALVVVRLIQGLGVAAVLPAAFSFIPHLARVGRQTLAFATVGTAGNIAQAICPALGLALLALSPLALFGSAALAAALAALVVLSLPTFAPVVRPPFGLTFRSGWLMPLLVSSLSVIQWGVITAFMPLAAVEAGANPGLLFTADAICVLVSRIPAGWIADRSGPLRLALLGVLSMALSPLVLLLPLTDTVLIVAGMLNGFGAGLTLPPMLATLSQRSDDSTRGSALSYFSVAFAIGMLLGSSVGGLLYAQVTFQGLLVLGALLCGLGIVVLLVDSITLGRAAPRAARVL